MPQLPVSRLINVTVNLSPTAAQAQDLSTLLILGSSDIIDTVERLRTYASIEAVAADFGTVAPEYLAALLWFEQAPQPFQLKIGRWAKTATKGRLMCAPLSAVNQLIATWNAITTGSLRVAVDGGGPIDLAGLNFSGAANLNAVATIIDTALAGATVVYNAVYQRFEFYSATTGAASAISFLSTTGAGSDISDNLAGRVTDSGSYVVPGLVAESALACVTIFDQTFGQQWYAVTLPEAVDADHLAVAPFIEACRNKHLYGVSTQAAGVLSAASTTDIAYLLSQLNYRRTTVQYNGGNPYSVCSLLGRALTVDYNSNSTVITLMYKQEPGITADQLSETQADAVAAKDANVFAAYQNATAIIQNGVMSSGDFIDEVTGTDWLAVTIMTAIFNLLYTSPTKIPQTDDGIHLLVTTIEAVCQQGVENGLMGPGTWTSNGFGTLTSGTYMSKGFYVYASPLSSQSAADRAARKSPPIKVAAKLAGAVHKADVIINVNR